MVAFGKKELCQLEDAVEKNMYVWVCLCAVQVLKETVTMPGFALGHVALRFLLLPFFSFVHMNFEARKLGNLEPSRNNTALL